ncbi:MAG: ABC transporter permease, partial [Oscillospiraceae bacterium]|nr:ABC transporter permease [Oscillospiraceae bacterium]
MKTYIIRRLLQMIPVFIGIVFILFFILEQAPGGPLSTIMDPRATPEQRAELEEKLGLDKPFYIKFVNWIGEAAQGNLGYSIIHKKTVAAVIGDYIGPTFALSIIALLISLAIGVPAGVISAVRQHSWIDKLLTVLSLV